MSTRLYTWKNGLTKQMLQTKPHYCRAFVSRSTTLLTGFLLMSVYERVVWSRKRVNYIYIFSTLDASIVCILFFLFALLHQKFSPQRYCQHSLAQPYLLVRNDLIQVSSRCRVRLDPVIAWIQWKRCRFHYFLVFIRCKPCIDLGHWSFFLYFPLRHSARRLLVLLFLRR